MSFALYTSDEIWEGADFGYTLAQLTGADGTFILPTGTGAPSDITLNVYDLSSDTPTTPVTIGAISVTDTILTPPQTGGGWTLDNTGFNFRHYLSASAVSGTLPIQGGHVYRLEYVVTTPAFAVGGSGGWGPIKAVRDVHVRALAAT